MSSSTKLSDKVPETAEVEGFVIQGYVASANEISESFGERLEEQLADRGIEDVDGNEWYSARKAQEAFYETKESIGSQTLINAGTKMAKLKDWPDHLTTVEDAIPAMDTSHQNTHRDYGDYDIGGYDILELEDGEARIDCTGFIYPGEIAQGAIKGTIETFQDDRNVVSVSEVGPESELVFEANW